MSHIDRVREAVERGERDAQLLDGRDFDAVYWRQARRSLSTLERQLSLAERKVQAYGAVLGRTNP